MSAEAAPIPPLPFERLLYVGTGSINASAMPYWVTWMRATHPDVELRIAASPAALSFVSASALAVLGGGAVFVDDWSAHPNDQTPHIDLADWPDAIAIAPATFRLVSRLALGLTESPVLLALHATDANVCVAPAVPDKAVGGPVLSQHLETISAWPGFSVAPFSTGFSAATREPSRGVCAPLPVVLELPARTGARAAGDG